MTNTNHITWFLSAVAICPAYCYVSCVHRASFSCRQYVRTIAQTIQSRLPAKVNKMQTTSVRKTFLSLIMCVQNLKISQACSLSNNILTGSRGRSFVFELFAHQIHSPMEHGLIHTGQLKSRKYNLERVKNP